MAKFLKVILFLILAAAFCGSVSDAFTVQTVDEITIAAQTGLGEEGNAQRNDVRQGSYIPAPQLPYLQVLLELFSCLRFHVHSARIQQSISFH